MKILAIDLGKFNSVACLFDTVLRLVMRLPIPQITNPKIVGVDDFAFRKCVSYGTIVVDLETHKPIAGVAESRYEGLKFPSP